MKIFSNVSFSLIGFLYIVVAGVLCYILPIPEIVKGFLALPGFLIIPYLIGNASFYCIKYFLKIDDEMNKISRFILYWCMGAVVITLVAMFLESINIFNIYSFVGFLGILSLSGVIKDISKNRLENNEILQKNNCYTFNRVFPLLLSFLIGIIPAIFITHFSPFPFIYGVDVFIWSFFSGTVINYGHLFADSSYFPIFSILGAITEIIFNMVPNLMPFFWTARFLTYPLYSIGIYLLIYQLSKNNKLSLLGSLVAVWFTVYNPPFIDLVLYFFTPKIVVFAIFPFLLYLIYTNFMEGKKKLEFKNKEIVLLLVIPMSYISILFLINQVWSVEQLKADLGMIYEGVVCFITLIYLIIIRYLQNYQIRKTIFIFMIACTTIFFFHIPMGLLALIILLLWLFIFSFITKYKSKSFLFIYLFIVGVILYFLLQFYGILHFSTISTRYGQDVMSVWPDLGNFHYLFNLITTSYLSSLFIFFYIGIILALVQDKHKYLNYSLVFVTFFIIFIYFLPITFMERLLPFFVPFLAYFISFGIISISSIIHRKSNLFSTLFFVLISIIVITSIINPYISTINKVVSLTPSYYPYFTFYSEEEYNTYKLLINEVEDNTKTIIIGDFHTRYIATGISQKDILAGGSNYALYLEKEIGNIFLEKDSKKAYAKINSLLSERLFTCYWYQEAPQKCDDIRQIRAIIIVTPREEWIFNQYFPDIEFKVNIEKFFNSTFFTPLYNDGEIYIFGVNPEPRMPFKIQNNTK